MLVLDTKAGREYIATCYVPSSTLESGLDNGVQKVEEGTLAITTNQFSEHIKEKRWEHQ
jgi:hypothetical protein